MKNREIRWKKMREREREREWRNRRRDGMSLYSERERKRKMRSRYASSLLTAAALVLVLLTSSSSCSCSALVEEVDWTEVNTDKTSRAQRDNTWVVIVDTSRYWLNYRHATNAFAIYRSVRENLGIPDRRILLFVAEDFATNSRNVFHQQLFADAELKVDVHEGEVEVDYAGDAVSVESLTRVLTGRQPESTPRSKTLSSDQTSDVLIYISGHGGENFMKFQDNEQMIGEDIADILQEMHNLRRYGRLTLVVDTCKAATFCQHITSPKTTCLASSLRGQNSYSKHSSGEVGNSLIDEMTWLLYPHLDDLLTDPKSLAAKLNRKMEYSTVDLKMVG